eukprot:2805903-Rhodomonas_salina.2
MSSAGPGSMIRYISCGFKTRPLDLDEAVPITTTSSVPRSYHSTLHQYRAGTATGYCGTAHLRCVYRHTAAVLGILKRARRQIAT